MFHHIPLSFNIRGSIYGNGEAYFGGGGPRDFSNMFDVMVHHLYYTCYNKISGISLSQCIPSYVHRCRELIHNALSDGAIWEVEYLNGEVVNAPWIHHRWDLPTFCSFGFLDNTDHATACPGGLVPRMRNITIDV